MDKATIALNAGSSSLKFAVYAGLPASAAQPKARGEASGLDAAPHLIVRGPDGEVLHEHRWPAGHGRDAATADALAWIRDGLGVAAPAAIGHRVVHGGPDFSGPARLTPEVVQRLRDLTSWAPLHQPAALAVIDAAATGWPQAEQVACFDTAFHHTQPAVATRLGLPRDLEAQGLRRYGFHGLSCAYVSGRMATLDPAVAGGRMLIAHLGAGASISAIESGRSIDTSMGFSPLDGLLMSTRCGSLDPGVVLFLQQTMGMEVSAVEDLLYRRSGLLGVSGISGDMRQLLDSPAPEAAEAVELFVFRAAREAGALVSSLAGLDGLVFTGGIGERAPLIRARLCQRLQWLGVAIDPALNAADGDRRISTPDSRVAVWVVATDEEQVIALESAALVGASA